MQEQDPLMGAIADEAAINPPQTEEGKQFLGDFVKAEQQATINKSSEFYNLAQDMDEGQRREIGQEIKRGFEDDDDSRADWLDMHENWLRLYNQTDYALNSDPERFWGATESIGIMTEACDSFMNRSYKAFFASKQFVSAVPQQHTPDPIKQQLAKERAERISRHMSWQLGTKMKNYKRDKRALLLATALHGSFFTKTYFDAYKKKSNCVENVRPTDLVINYTYGSKPMEDVRRKSHIIRTTVGETKILANKDWLIEAARADDGESYTQYDQAADESQGIAPPSNFLLGDRGATLIEQQVFLDIDENGYPIPYLATVDWSGRLLRLTIDYEADVNGNPLKDYEQNQYYTHYKFAENPDGFYGLGFGAKIGDLNSAINISMRQMMDAATLANDGNNSGYISSRLCMDGEEQVTLTLGKLKKVPDTTGDLSNGIMMMKFQGPNESQFKLTEMLINRGERMTSTTDATTGDLQKNMQPTTVLALIEQSLEQISGVQESLKDDLGDELTKLYRLNSKHLPLIEYFTINDVPEAITRADYQDDMMVEPVFDPKSATKAQKVAKAEAEWKAIMENPLSQMRPQVFDEGTRRRLKAIDADNIDALVPPTPLEQIVAFITAQQAQQPGQAQAQPGGGGPMAGRPGNGMAPQPALPTIPGSAGFNPAQNSGAGSAGQFRPGNGLSPGAH